jgi:UbiD family decarboxylase
MLTDLRALVDYLRRQQKLLVVEREVDPRFELNAVIRKIQAGANLPVLFKHVRGTRFPVLSNALGNYGLVAQLLGVEIGRLAARWAELSMPNAAPVTEEHPSVTTDWHEISLDDLPHIVFCEKDAGPYITAGVVIARDPDTEVVNLSYHRLQMIGPEELRGRLSTSGDLYRIQQIAESKGKALPVVIAIGLPPAVMLAAGTTVGPDHSEYELAARISGKRFPLVPSPRLGLPVPAATEILIEGEILAGVRRPEGPFGEWMDYYVPVTDNHVFRIDRVYARKDAIYYAVSAGNTEEGVMISVPMAGTIYTQVRTWVSSVTDVTCFPFTQYCVLQMKKQFEGQAQKAILTAFGSELNHLLYCIAVDEDVDIHNWHDVLWAMATRCRPDQGIFQIPGVPSFSRDPHKIHWGRLGIDATKPLAHAADFERKTTPGLRALKLEDYLVPNP